jgi:predicted MFS family arabinose efflux permease
VRLLRQANFRKFWIGETVSLFGNEITLIALPLAGVLVLDADAAEMGYLGAALLMPHLLFSLPAGVWLERVAARRQVMIVCDVGRALLLASIPLTHAFDSLTFAQLYLVAFATGTLTVLFDISYTTLYVAIVPRESYIEANSLISGSRSFAYIGGPSLGGALVQALSAPVTLLADGVTFVVSALFLSRLHAPEPPLERRETRIRDEVREGLSFVFRHPILRPALLGVSTLNLFNFAFWALFLLYATQELGIRPATLGLVLGAGAVGGLIGALVAGRIGRRIGLGPAYLLGMVLFPAPLILVPAAGGPKPLVLAILFVSEFVSGLGVMILDINASAFQTALTPDRLRARATGAFRVVNYGVRPLGALLGGALGSAMGLRPALWLSTIAALAGILWMLPSPIPRMHELPEPAE